jgi:hypothetical protein
MMIRMNDKNEERGEYLILPSDCGGTKMLVDDQEGQRILFGELGVGHGVTDVLGGVDASAELCALGRCAAEADSRNLLRVLRAVESRDGLLDFIALFVLCVHVMLSLVAQARDFTKFEVEVVDDFLDEI